MLRTYFTALMGVVFFLSIMAADSESWVPLYTLIASGAWLAFAAWRSGLLYVAERDDEE